MTATRHIRFVIAFGISLGAGGLAMFAALPLTTCILIAADTCFALYLGLELRLAASLTSDMLRSRAAQADEGLPLIFMLALATIIISLSAIFSVIATPTGSWAEAALALATIPLGWAVLHTMAAFHYAYLFYAPKDGQDSGGISFPDTPGPGVTEFLYFSFTIGMTAQVSDVTLRQTALRKAVLIHGIGSFFYNTSILALAVSAALTLGR